jgi:thiol-disulfide isomerase/thioredoxin
VIAFSGTWCGDSKYLLPKFFALTDAAGLSPDRITLIGVDRNKKTVQHLSETFKVDRIPTFIVMKNGREIGRVSEYGNTGMFDRELGEIVSGKKQ